ncbi:MAG TPA: hypothetical protein VKZ53_13245 [Candidatus Angelobacter sp.]|nr:hypothetical protein [Candidatus Angelobacter sp.]
MDQKKPSKLVLHQESVANLTGNEPSILDATHHSCIRSVCGLACTPVAIGN